MAGGGHDLVVGAEPSLSLADVEQLLRDDDDEDLVAAISCVYGVVIGLAPLAFGPAGFALWPLLDVKNELANAVTKLLPFLTSKRTEPYTARLQRMKIAVTTLVYVAYVDEASHLIKSWPLKVEVDRISRNRAESESGRDIPDIVLRKPPIIGPSVSFTHYRRFAKNVYESMTSQLFGQLRRHSDLIDIPDRDAAEDNLVTRALLRLDAAFVELCVNHDELLVWAQCDAVLRGNEHLGERLRDVLARQTEIDLGLARLQDLTRELASSASRQVPRAVEAIHRAYTDDLSESISLADDLPTVEGIDYPTKGSAFVPQRFAYAWQDGALAIHDEQFWAARAVHEDVGLFLLRSFLAADAVHRPILILGHPGSGKSMLSEMLAARLTPPFFTTVRVSLRETDASKEIEDQIQDAVRRATGLQVNWFELSEIAEAAPIVIFDGLDELLLATGNSHVNYLDRLARFQHREFIQGRPIRIVVTSRLTLIHRMRVANRTCVVRLLDFDTQQQKTWTQVWNAKNQHYFDRNGLKQFELPQHELIRSLAAQPLLLLMLAIFDSYENNLAEAAATSKADLYDSIVRKFIERERGKRSDAGGAFQSLDATRRERIVARDMDRLSVVALAMHKRGRVFVTKDELDADLARYGRDAVPITDDVLALSSAETIFGEFFFIHRSQAAIGLQGDERSFAFEFLHNTFGEFLLAALFGTRLAERARALDRAASWPEASEVPRMEAAAAALPRDLCDALEWSLLCVRPVVLEMLGDLLSRPQLAPDLAKVNELISRELRTCTVVEDDESRASLAQRAVKCANLLSIATTLPERPCVVACDAKRWQQIVGILRGSLSFEEVTQLVSSLDATFRGGIVELVSANVVLDGRDIPGAAHRVAVALSDSLLITATSVATLDSLTSLEDRIPGRLSDHELLFASRVLRPAIWRRLNKGDRDRLVTELCRSARVGLRQYPNSSLAAFNVAARSQAGATIVPQLPAIMERSLGDNVEAELVLELVLTLVARPDFDGLVRENPVALHPRVLEDAVAPLRPFVGRLSEMSQLMDRTLIALCWLICCASSMTDADLHVVVERVLTRALIRHVGHHAPSMIWLPAATWLTFSPPSALDETWMVYEEIRAVALAMASESVESMLPALRGLWLLGADSEELTRVVKRAHVSTHEVLISAAEVIDSRDVHAGWRYLEGKVSQLGRSDSRTSLSFGRWLRDVPVSS